MQAPFLFMVKVKIRSPIHYFDQAQLYAEGQFKEAYFDKKDVEAHAERTYYPGENSV